MNKRGLFGVIIIFVLVVAAYLPIAFLSAMSINSIKEANAFCENNGYEYSERGTFRWDNNICVKTEDGYRVERLYGKCREGYCFVKSDLE